MDSSLKSIIIGSISFLSGMGLAAIIASYNPKKIPNISEVQEGYVPPRYLEVICKDYEEDGKPETYLSIRGKKYHLKEIEGKPTLLPY